MSQALQQALVNLGQGLPLSPQQSALVVGRIEQLTQELAQPILVNTHRLADSLADERAKVARLEAEVGSLWTCNEELEKAVNNSDRVRARQGRALNQLSAENARLRAALKDAQTEIVAIYNVISQSWIEQNKTPLTDRINTLVKHLEGANNE